MTYIIGDVHGHYDTLVALVEKLSKDAKLIFVGDLVDRGLKSKEVIAFVRENNHQCVLGNHEEFMIDYGKSFLAKYPKSINTSYLHTWLNNGGKETLLSYDLITIEDGEIIPNNNQKALERFKSDIQWLESLPLYIELPHRKNDKPIVVSHANIGNVWHFHNNKEEQNIFREYALWNRNSSDKECSIFNIFGHTPTHLRDTTQHNINVDTGCYINDVSYARLSCYCVEENRFISIRKVEK